MHMFDNINDETWLTLLWSLWLMSPWRAEFWCARPCPTGTSWTGTHGEMISSDLHGAEVPIRWLLGPHQGQRQETSWLSFCTWEEEGHFIHDTLAEPSPGGLTHFRWNVSLWWPRTSPRSHWRHLQSVAVWQGSWHVWQGLEAQRGPTFCHLWCILP